MPYATVREFRAAVDKTVAEDDQVIKALLSSATGAIDKFINHYQQDGAGNDVEAFNAITAATVKVYSGSGRGYQWIDECVEVTQVAVRDSITAAVYTIWVRNTDWLPFAGGFDAPNYNRLPYNGILIPPNSSYAYFTSGLFSGIPGFPPDPDVDNQRSVPTVQVTARWGYSDNIPPEINTACIMQAVRWYKRLQGAMSDTLASEDLGLLLYRKEIDPDVKNILIGSRYYRPAIGRH